MKTLSALISEYKETGEESLKKMIWDFLMTEDNINLFKDIFVYRDDSDWVEYENNIRLKRLCPKVFLATQVLQTLGERYACYCYRLNLADYSEKVLEAQRNSNLRLERFSPDEEFFTAAALLTSISPENAIKVQVANGMLEVDNWYQTIERLAGSTLGATDKE